MIVFRLQYLRKTKVNLEYIVEQITGATYVGSAVDLSIRLIQYYSLGYLKNELLRNNSIIYKALLKYGYLGFQLEILEYCEPRDTIEREQYYIDLLVPVYNILKTAGSLFDFKHS
jgi:group I intron endonuclease